MLSRRKLTTLLCDIVQTTIVLSLLLFDAVIFGLTVRKTYRHVRDMRRLRQLSIVQVVLRDGQCNRNARPSQLFTCSLVFYAGALYFLQVTLNFILLGFKITCIYHAQVCIVAGHHRDYNAGLFHDKHQPSTSPSGSRYR